MKEKTTQEPSRVGDRPEVLFTADMPKIKDHIASYMQLYHMVVKGEAALGSTAIARSSQLRLSAVARSART